MKERPILFSGVMVRALLAGTKTQTRRVVKGIALDWLRPNGFTPEFTAAAENHLCPYGVPGDRLWVREAFGISYDGSVIPWTGADAQRDGEVIYRATFDEKPEEGRLPWKPSIHMPRWASRITLEVTGVRVERLQDISEADARAEGARECDFATGREVLLAAPNQRGSFVLHYRDIWEQINGPGSWGANPWVWVVEFKRANQEPQGAA